MLLKDKNILLIKRGNSMLDFRIETFLMVTETMNFTEAAKRLHITQPAVSQHIHFLEKEYAVIPNYFPIITSNLK